MAVDGYRAALVASLRRAFDERSEIAQLDDAALIDFVCLRRALVSGDPGWIELHFALTDVSTEIRLAGLDLDPGWIPWLGVVVRLIYA
jgi:hypothetical protein